MNRTWRSPGYNDAVWSSGPAPLGYRYSATPAHSGIATRIPSNAANDNTTKYITSYYRKSITVSNLANTANFTLNLKRDDGAVVFVNGVEVARSNLTTVAAVYSTLATTSASDNGDTPQVFTIPTANFIEGANVVAVEIHQDATSSSDVFFDMELKANVGTATNYSLLPFGSTWKYLDDGSNQGTAWQAAAFNDASWVSGPAELGYGDGDENTILNSSGGASRPITDYFRKTVNIPSVSAFSSFTLNLVRDDGAVVYVNGTEVYRTSNLPASGNVAYNAYASIGATIGGTDEYVPVVIPNILPSVFVNGSNLIAVEIHQESNASSDVSFDLQLLGTTIIPQPPVASNPDNQTAVVGLPFSYTVPAFTDPNNQAITYTASGFSADFSFNSTTRELSGTPTTATGSPFSVTVTGTNASSLSARAVFTLSVTTMAVAPGATLTASNSGTLTCANPTLTLTASATATGGAYTYSFAGPGILTTTANSATVNASGTYSVTITDGVTSLTSTASTTIFSETTTPTATLANNGPITAAQTSATLTASTGTGFTYIFSAGATPITSSNQATVTSAGTYSVVVTGANGCTATASTTVDGTFVVPSNNWSYFDKGVTPPAQGSLTWKDPAFTEPTSGTATWGSGSAPLGYGNYPTATTVSFGPSSTNKYITTYFRRVFTFTQAQLAQNYRYKVRYRRDDGIAIYVNGALRADGGGTQTGVEVRRENMPTGTLTNTTVATATVGTDVTWYEFYLPNGSLRPGDNLIAAEIHQAAANSSDIFFDLELVADSNPNMLVSQSLPVTSAASTNWKYWDEGVSLDNINWKALTFDDQYWQQTNIGTRLRTGYGETGDPSLAANINVASTNPYNANDYTNYVSFGLQTGNKFPTHYFRKKINIPNTTDYSNYEFRFMRDDAIVLFVNGIEITRDNIETSVATTSPVPFSALAETTIDGADETAWSTWRPISASLIQNGDNIIAVEIHQRGGYPISSSDMTFNLEVRATPNIPLGPVASNPTNQTALLGLPFSYTIPAFTDPNGDAITYTASGFSSDFTFNGSTRVLSGTAQSLTGSPFSVTIVGTDPGSLSANATFTLTVNPAPVPTLVRGPYLQNATSSAMTLRWRTDVTSQGVVRYGTSAGALTGTASETTTGTDHEVRITGLAPQTQYFYSIGTSTMALEGSAVNFFNTFPNEGSDKKIRIWSLGDFGAGTTRQTRAKNQMKKYIASQGDPYIDLFLWMGDNAYDQGTDVQYQNYVFDRSTSNAWSYGYEKILKQTPIYATPGNHDYGNSTVARERDLQIPYYDIMTNPSQGEAGGVPSGTESYYSFNYGQAHFISLDSDRLETLNSTERFRSDQPQVMWLKQDLIAAKANPNIKWIIAFWHHPPYTKGTHDSDTESNLVDVRQNLIPVLEQYGVDLVMNGHSHVYERSRLQKNNFGVSSTYDPAIHNPEDGSNAKSSGRFDGSTNSCYYFKSSKSPDNEGVIYAVNGHGGRSGGQLAGWPLAQMESAYNQSDGGSMYLEIEGGVLTAKMIAGSDGSVIDQFTIIKDAGSFTVPASALASKSATCECTDKGDSKTHYTDNNLNKLLSIQKNGQNIGKVGDGTFTLQLTGAGATAIPANAPTNYVSTPGGWSAMNRFFALTPTTEPANPVNLSFYYKQADVDAINGQIDPDLNPNQLYAYKMNNVQAASVDPTTGHPAIPLAATYDANGAFIYKPGSTTSTTDWKFTSLGNNTYQADLAVAKLSGGGGLGGPNPVTTNTVPVATANANQTATVGQAFAYTVNAFSDAETPNQLTYTTNISPANGLSFDPATRIISGTPSMSGVSSVTATATDPGSLSASTTFTITVQPAPVVVTPLALTLTASPAMLTTSGTTTLSAMVSGGSVPYSYSFTGPGTISPSGNSASVSNLPTGVQTFTVVARDATLPTSQTISGTVSVTVTQAPPANTGPVATMDVNQTATVGVAFSYLVNAFSDAETPNQLTYSASINPANGLSFDPATRIISGTPSTSGVSSVTVTATDPGSLSASTTFTITVSPAPVVSNVQLTVLHQDVSFGQTTTNTILPYLQLVNSGAASIPYSTITVRYWLTVEGNNPVTNFQNYYVQIGANNVHERYVPLSTPRQGATGYVEYSFDAAAGNLGGGTNSGPIQNGFTKADYSVFNQSDDYSYAANRDYVANARMTAYVDGVLVYGQEPPVGVRVGATNSEVPLRVQVLGNPLVNEVVEVMVSGGEGQSLLYQLTDASGQVVGEQRVDQAGSPDHRRLRVMGQSAGVLLLRVSTPTQSQTVKVLKRE